MRAWAVVISLLAWLMTSAGAQAERRVALVIGNGAYRDVASLPNSAGDASAMAALLRTVGFEVLEGTDLTSEQMDERLQQFRHTADDADVALLYYSGHGF